MAFESEYNTPGGEPELLGFPRCPIDGSDLVANSINEGYSCAANDHQYRVYRTSPNTDPISGTVTGEDILHPVNQGSANTFVALGVPETVTIAETVGKVEGLQVGVSEPVTIGETVGAITTP